MSTFLTQVNGFTPLIDAVVADAGLNEALVYGMVWRYCRMQNGVCYASTTTIGHRLGLSRRTVQRCMTRLVKLGYLTDKTPGLKNRAHVYADSGLVRIRGLIEVTESTAPESHTAASESHTTASQSHTTASESHTTASESRSETIPLRQRVAVTAPESHMNRVFKREKEKRENLRDAGFLQSPHPGARSSQPPLDAIEWEKVKNELRLQMTAAVFDTWVKQTTAHRHGDTLVITPRNRFAYEWLNMRLRPTIAKTVKQICGRHTTIDFVNPADAGEQEPQGPAYGERE